MRNRLYYLLKPLLPWSARITVRRWLARSALRSHQATWPIRPSAGQTPEGWPGWPENRQFALILTHDVEGPEGVERVRPLVELEQSLGFRSSFNFIPEGAYADPAQLRHDLQKAGFEVGVHDLRHDGSLFASQASFRRQAGCIKRHLKAWNANGFRAGFMFHNLEWIHELGVQYDASTFDTDPFEPQPGGVNTIFPFWVPAPSSSLNPQPSTLNSDSTGYVELPYTLPQDSTLFFILQETGIDIWQRKLAWIAQHQGMALLNVHPDYLQFDNEPSRRRAYPIQYYREFLERIRRDYSGRYWNALPRDVAQFVTKNRPVNVPSASRNLSVTTSSIHPQRRIWIDLDNTPHVPFFLPIIRELEHRGHKVILTAREAFQVCELADQKGLKYQKVGRHHGKNRFMKFTGLFYRACQLAPVVLPQKPDLGVSHGSRSQSILCQFARIPSVILTDYEHARVLPFMGPTWEMAPDVVPDHLLACPPDRIRKYPGLKEDVYVPSFRPDPCTLAGLPLHEHEIMVTVRPPATEAHYHNPESEGLFERFMDRANRTASVRIVLLPRNRRQGDEIKHRWPHWFAQDRTVIPAGAIDGLNLLWRSDLVVSGGGTMNREAAALGVPVYSIFRGPLGAVDQWLEREGRMTMIRTPEDTDRKILLQHRQRQLTTGDGTSTALNTILKHLEEILSKY